MAEACTFLAALAAVTTAAPSAFAHTFTPPHHLSAPLSLYQSGAAAAVVAAFAARAAVARRRHPPRRPGVRLAPLETPAASVPIPHALLTVARVSSVGILLCVLGVGFAGAQNPFRNLASVFVWDLWWPGMVLASAFLGNLWSVINPWPVAFSWAAALSRLVRPDGASRPRRAYPSRLAAWPAVALFLVLAWLALVWRGTATPAALAGVIAVYSLITWLGMAVFGRDAWLRHGEAVTVVFALLARFAPIAVRRDEQRSATVWQLRLPGAGLIGERALHPASAVLVALVLAAAAFDALGDTPVWGAIMDRVIVDATLWPLWSALERLGLGLFAAVKTVAWVVFAALVVATLLGLSRLGAWLAGGRVATAGLAGALALSLVPVVVAFYVAHDAIHLPTTARLLAALAAEPLGLGWEVLTAAIGRGAAGTPAAALAWSVTVAAIAVGHAMAAWLALETASRVAGDERRARRSQLPVVAFLVGHAAIGLWVLSQPVVARGGG